VEAPAAVPEPAATAKAEPAPGPAAQAAPTADGSTNGRIKASPLARRIARERGVDLARITGTGPDGRIVAEDVERAEAAPAAQDARPVRAQPPSGEVETRPLSKVRKTIARRLSEAKQQVPHIYLTVDIQLDPLLKLRGELNAGLESRNIKLSVNDLLIKALAQALMAVPECNVAFAGDRFLRLLALGIGVNRSGIHHRGTDLN
jgi:pyruvate dehydrogenase E2 component (dihydrolipoamide acetyltransferase)